MRQFFEEQDGKLSMTRLIIFMLTTAYILQAGYIAAIDRIITDVPYGIAGLMAALYGLNTDFLKLHVGVKKGEEAEKEK